MSVTFNTAQFVIGTLEPVDASGKLATYQKGTIIFTSSDPTVFTVQQSTDNELVADLTAVGVGAASLTYTGVNIAGTLLTGTASVTVIPVPLGDAVEFLITFSSPEQQTTSTTTSTTTTEATTV